MTVWGHTDTAEDADLSIGRARAVRDALVREGVPAEVIAAFGRGPLLQNVRTGFNVQEPQNRRAEGMFW
jgi:OOP family OmpA-OmpF porin